MQVSPFILLSQSALADARSTLAAALAAWERDWGINAGTITLQVERACEAARPAGVPDHAWQRRSGNGQAAVWQTQPAELLAEMQVLLFPRDGSHGPQSGATPQLAPVGARSALAALHAALAQAALAADAAPATQAQAPPQPLWQRGQGAALVTVKLGKLRCHLLLNHLALKSLSATAAPKLAPLAPVNRRHALETSPVTLQLDIGTAHVSLASLMSLAVGDVVRLNRKVDEPVRMTDSGGAPVFDAYLGRVGEQIAVEAIHSQSSQSGAVKP